MTRQVLRWLPAVALAVAMALALSGAVDTPGRTFAAEALQRSLVTFAVARTLNGVISVAQETEIALEPGGVGVVLMPGELLDPINDLIERFSWVMLASAASLGVQSTLLRISAWWGMNVFLVAAGLVWVYARWRPDGVGPRWSRIFGRVLLLGLFLRFSVPVLLLATQLVSNLFLDEDRTRATQALSATSTEIRALNETSKEAGDEEARRSLLERMSDFVGESVDALDVEARVAALRERLSGAVTNIVDLIVVFALETILIPIAFLWLLVQIAGRLVGGR